MEEEVVEQTQEQPVDTGEVQETPESLLSALQKEKEDWGFEREKSETRASLLQGYLSQFTKPQENTDPFPDVPDDHYFTKKDILKVMSEMEGKFDKRHRESIGRESLKKAKAKYSNFDELMKLTGEIIRDPYVAEQAGFGNMDVYQIIESSDDPAEAIARFAMFHPGFKRQSQSETTAAAVEKIQKNLNQPKTLSSAPQTTAKGKGDNSENAFDWSKEEFEKRRNKALGGM